MTIFGIQLIDRVGRRKLLLIGAAGMCISEFMVAIVGVTAGHPTVTASGIEVNLAAQRVLIAFTCMLVVHLSLSHRLLKFFLYSYIAFFATSWGPVIWVLTGELFVSFFLSIIPFFC
jgi:MFS family permease